MKMETLKSIILVGLIGLSLVLTIAIWNFQPNNESDSSDGNTIEAKIGGIIETKKSIIEPSHLIFHVNGIHQGHLDKQMESALYEEMQNWSVYDFSSRTAVEPLSPNDSQQYIEVIFPTALPSDIIQDLFTMNEDPVISGREFDRMYIILDEDQSNEQVQFVDTENKSKLIANIQNFTEERENILEYYETGNELIEYITFEGINDIPIYIPKDPVTIERHPFQAKEISKVPLRNALFPRPSAVRSNDEDILGAGEVLTDAQRKLFISKSYYAEFTNPIQTENEGLEGRELITETLEFINDHAGWTTEAEDEYILYDLNLMNDTVEYRLVYNGYPVIENQHLSTITVSMRDQFIHQYNRPLIQIQSPLYGQQVTLPSGESVINEINRSNRFSSQLISDIQIGYRIEEQGAKYVFTLTPAWFIKDSLGWRELTFDEIQVKGGEG